ncbi:hypothetical protein pb186bvf_004827 [Paramecium bursaria]
MDNPKLLVFFNQELENVEFELDNMRHEFDQKRWCWKSNAEGYDDPFELQNTMRAEMFQENLRLLQKLKIEQEEIENRLKEMDMEIDFYENQAEEAQYLQRELIDQHIVEQRECGLLKQQKLKMKQIESDVQKEMKSKDVSKFM